jgi:hypothetical protein
VSSSPAAGLVSLASTDVIAPSTLDRDLLGAEKLEAEASRLSKALAKDFKPIGVPDKDGKEGDTRHQTLIKLVKETQGKLLEIRREVLKAQAAIAAAADETKALDARKKLNEQLLAAQQLLNAVAIDKRALSIRQERFEQALAKLDPKTAKKEDVDKAYKDSFNS